MRRTILAALCVAMASVALAGEQAARDYLTWTRLESLPDAAEVDKRLGRAGMFAGVHNDALILAGGANFPVDRLKDGKKTYYDDIFVLVKSGEKYTWIRPKAAIGGPLAYGAAVATDAGLVCLGGEWQVHLAGETAAGSSETKFSPKVFVLAWDKEARTLTKTDRLITAADRDAGQADKVLPLPALPEACSFMAAAKVGSVIYVAGGQRTSDAKAPAMKTFWSLDLSKKTDPDAFKWQRLAPWPGPGRMKALAAAQSDGENECFYLFSGSSAGAPLTDAYRYRPKDNSWRKGPDVGVGPDGNTKTVACVAAGCAAPFGDHHILVFGGGMFPTVQDPARKDHVEKMAALALLKARADAAADAAAKTELQSQISALEANLDKTHPGFQRTVWAFHTVTGTWTRLKDMPTATPPVTTPAVRWGDDIIIPSGEIRPGVRSPAIWRISPKKREAMFGAANWIVMAVYLLALLAMGFYFSKRENTTSDFFLGGRRIPWWAAGLSIYGTMLSAITFMAIPYTTYRSNWLRILDNWMIIPTCAVVAVLIVPFYSRLRVTTAYEYLERRFNVVLRLYGSVTFILMQIGRIGIVMLLPAMTLSVVMDVDVYTSVLIMGVLCTIYTVMGGIEAVIWTDVLQVFVLLGGAIVSLVIICFNVPGGIGGIISTGMADSKLDMALMSWDYTELALWVVLIGAPLTTMVSYTTDQAVVQRYLTTSDPKQARRSLLTTCVIVGPTSLIFFGMGTALFAFYKVSPHLLDPTVEAKAIFPFFILQNLPAGVAGLVIAAVFAASMSSLDSSMNSIATSVTTDMYRRFTPGAPDRKCLALARWITVIVGIVGMAVAMVMAYYGKQIQDLWKLFGQILGLLGGGMLGVFLLGMFTRRATAWGSLVGAAAGAGVQTTVVCCTKVSFMLYAGIGAVTCMIVGYGVSLAFGAERKDLAGLTIHTQQKTDA